MLRGLRHFWRINLAVVAAAAVNTAVLTGALLVGDSVRGSLRDMTLDRLGEIDQVLVGERFFRAGLADDLPEREEFAARFDAVAPAVVLQGTAVHGDTRARASSVNVLGVDGRFRELYEGDAGEPPPELDLSRRQGQIFPSVIVNESLRSQLDAETGDPVLLHFQLGSDVPRDTLLGSTDPEDAVGTVRLTLVDVVPDEGLGRFGLTPHQTFPLNAWVDLEQLQRAVDQPGGANALLLAGRADAAGTATEVMEGALSLEDVGLELRPLEDPGGTALVLESEEFVLRPGVEEAAAAVAADLGVESFRVITYLANSMQVGDRQIPYSTVSALAGDYPPLTLVDGGTAPVPDGDEILLGEWAAGELGAGPGDQLRMTYYRVGPRERMLTGEHAFTVAGVVRMTGLAADRDLTPAYPGIEGAEDMSAWDPPFPVELGRIRPVDETYWDEHGATPKAFVAAGTARELWGTRYGSVTSLRLRVPGSPPDGPTPAPTGPSAAGSTPGGAAGEAVAGQAAPTAGRPTAEQLEAFEATVSARLLGAISLPEMGLRLMPVKEDGLRAASGATDFGGLFIGFSFFLIVSASLLAGLLFSLGVERRAGEVGLRLAVGFRLGQVRRRMLVEGGVLAAVGGVLGVAGGVGYGAALMAGLRTLWVEAVGSPRLFLHVQPLTLAAGWAISLLVVLVAIGATVRRLGKVSTTGLLRGSLRPAGEAPRRAGRVSRLLALGSGCLAAALFAGAVATGTATSPALAMGIGVLVLVCGLSAFSVWCRGVHRGLERRRGGAVWSMAARNSAWNPGRSILSVALVACASFIIVAVAANHRDPAAEAETVAAGGGGYELMAGTDVPLHHDLESPAGRADLGLSEETGALLERARITAFRSLPGDDASCLNLYRPQRPTILGVPPEQIERGGFRFAATLEGVGETDDPWELLEADLGENVVPAFGDANSMQWILKLGLGQELVVEDQRGRTVRIRLVGTLSESIFQSEMLISEENFLRHFPDQSGYRTFLVDTPEGAADEVARALESGLETYGFDAVGTAEKVAGFLVVQNTYLSTFQLLGGLGLLLGTLGLGIVLVRNVIERRGELATLRAFGFRRRSLIHMVLAENTFLLLLGLALGSVSALLAVTPRYLSGAIDLPWSSLAWTLALVAAVGTLSSVAAVVGALRVPLLPVLKEAR